ncbi:PQQ-dependent sugar dehydrogenase [Pokkaliibacter sp. MBI-7]|uniref:PQQ-dependent sugar dehydrogenase n=1 Tax=Pokkaliibacter sp. MBI-7 TaxID=3040600 RepID=UPI0024468A21|nr:PQQ-dependent sugar dehydrogenase [Pokkaliibacter sp. MBI-7]MDH2435888.1 PQQ-dependent sugar dehydrogenase [Pokkaliibacter sp. MBI-7]
MIRKPTVLMALLRHPMTAGIVLTAALLLLLSCKAMASTSFSQQVLLERLNQPWSLAFLSEQEVLITEKGGALLRVNLQTRQRQHISGLPTSTVHGQGGLLDVALHPDFNTNHWLYLTYTRQVGRQFTTALARGRLSGNTLTDVKELLISKAASDTGHHFGSRLAFDKHGYLYMSVGERGDRHNAQMLTNHAGKILRLRDDGSVPPDNPLAGLTDALPEIYSYGHRNPQGLAYDPKTDRMWSHEHGPRGGDEVNLLVKGANYGWPLVTFGREYSGLSITSETTRPGIEPPRWVWVPSIAPSGLAVYRGKAFPDWQGDLLLGGLAGQLLVQLEMNEDQVIQEDRYQQQNLHQRVRDVRVGPDGLIYLLTDGANAQLIRLSPL